MKRGLGKGLDVLIKQTGSSPAQETSNEHQSFVTEIDINLIEPNKKQPRKYFDEASLMELAESIKSVGVVQPIIVNKNEDFYTIIAGERRWRACRIAKLTKIPVIIKEYTEAQALEVALIENLQRKDLNPIEEGHCYRHLIDEYFFTQESLSERIGRHRNHIARAISLLALNERVQSFLVDGRLTLSHGILLLPLSSEEQITICEAIMENDLSVKETESLIKAMNSESEDKKIEKPQIQEQAFSAHRHIETELNTILGTKVNIKEGKNKGRIEVEYYNEDELDRLVCLFKRLQGGQYD